MSDDGERQAGEAGEEQGEQAAKARIDGALAAYLEGRTVKDAEGRRRPRPIAEIAPLWEALWDAVDYSWNGLAQPVVVKRIKRFGGRPLSLKTWTSPPGFPLKAPGPDGTTLQDYWRWSAGVDDDEPRWMGNDEMERLGLLVRDEGGKLWHVVHRPDPLPETAKKAVRARIKWCRENAAVEKKAAAQSGRELTDALAPFSLVMEGARALDWTILLPVIVPDHRSDDPPPAPPSLSATLSEIEASAWRGYQGVKLGPCSQFDFSLIKNNPGLDGDGRVRGRIFGGCELGNEANFSEATLGDMAIFRWARLGDGANFCGATLGDRASFRNATLGEGAEFFGATLGDGIGFSGATLGDGADFREAKLGDGADFFGATLGDAVNFSAARLGDRASFRRARLGDGASFRRAKLGDEADFSRATLGDGADFRGSTLGDGADFVGATFGGGFAAKALELRGRVNFEKATFEGTADLSRIDWFRGRKEDLRRINLGVFEGARFFEQADFRAEDFAAFGIFNDATFRNGLLLEAAPAQEPTKRFDKEADALRAFLQTRPDEQESEDARENPTAKRDRAWRQLSGGYRAAKVEMERQGDFERAQTFYRFEVKARMQRPGISWPERLAAGFYNLFSDYGASIGRPLVGIIAFTILFAVMYLSLDAVLAQIALADGHPATIALYIGGALLLAAILFQLFFAPLIADRLPVWARDALAAVFLFPVLLAPVFSPYAFVRAQASLPLLSDDAQVHVPSNRDVEQSVIFSMNNAFRPLSVLSSDEPRERVGKADSQSFAEGLLFHENGLVQIGVRLLAIVQSLLSFILAFLFGLAVRRKFQIS